MNILAENYGENSAVDAKSVAEIASVPQRFALKILRKLMGAGLVKSYKGAAGGYSLSSAPENITLKQIVEVTEGPLTISLCLGEGFECNHGVSSKSACYFFHVFDDINAMIAARLDSITLAEATLNRDVR